MDTRTFSDRLVSTERVTLAIVLLLAAIPRLVMPTLSQFDLDEARVLSLAAEIATGTRFPLAGPIMTHGMPSPPALYYIYAIPLLIWNHVIAATLFTGIANVLAVAALWWFARRYWGAKAALAATILYAISPWAVHHSRAVWAPDILPPIVLMWAISGVLAFGEQRRWFLLLHAVSLICAIQVHPTTIALAVVTLGLILISWKRLDWQIVLLSIAMVLLLTAPYAVHLLRNQALSSLLVTPEGQVSWLNTDILKNGWRLVTGANFHSLAGPDQFQTFLRRSPLASITPYLIGALTIVGIVLLALNLRETTTPLRRIPVALILGWVLVPPVLYLFAPIETQHHYLLPILPAAFIAAGIGFAFLLRHSPKLLWGLLFIAAAAQLWSIIVMGNLVAKEATPGGFGVPLRYQLQAVEWVEELERRINTQEILVAGSGDNQWTEAFPTVFSTLLRPHSLRTVDLERYALFPARRSVVLMSRGNKMSALYLSSSGVVYKAKLRDNKPGLLAFIMPASSSPTPEYALNPTAVFDNLVSFEGYDWEWIENSSELVLRLHWKTGTASQEQWYFYCHLTNKSGEIISQDDQPAFPAFQWQPGDEVVSSFRVDVPAEQTTPLTLKLGMYRFPSMQRALVLDEAANPFTDGITLTIPQLP